MGLIQNLISKFKEKNAYSGEYAEEMRMRENYEKKRLSHNERELMDYMEKQRQSRIAHALERIKQRERHEFWHKDVISQKNIFGNQRCIFANQKSILKAR